MNFFRARFMKGRCWGAGCWSCPSRRLGRCCLKAWCSPQRSGHTWCSASPWGGAGQCQPIRGQGSVKSDQAVVRDQ